MYQLEEQVDHIKATLKDAENRYVCIQNIDKHVCIIQKYNKKFKI